MISYDSGTSLLDWSPMTWVQIPGFSFSAPGALENHENFSEHHFPHLSKGNASYVYFPSKTFNNQ